MRVKQRAALILLLFANIFLLAHVVVPHSHHDGIVCFSLAELEHRQHCSGSHDDAENCCCEKEEQSGHHHSNSEDCDLKEIVLRQDNDSHEDILPCDHCLSLLYSIYPLNDLYQSDPEYGQRLEIKPYLITYISPYVGTITSLRAPPASYFLG